MTNPQFGPFNLAMAKKGHPVVTAGGRKVNIITFERTSTSTMGGRLHTYPIRGYVEGCVASGNDGASHSWTLDGHEVDWGPGSDMDLRMDLNEVEEEVRPSISSRSVVATKIVVYPISRDSTIQEFARCSEMDPNEIRRLIQEEIRDLIDNRSEELLTCLEQKGLIV